MSDQHEGDVTVDALPGSATGRCVDLLCAAMQREPGVQWAHLDIPSGRLSLRYDPTRTSAARVRRLARRQGAAVARQYEGCALRLDGGSCRDCLLQLQDTLPQKNLPQEPGARRVVLNPAAESIAVEYDASGTGSRTVEQHLANVGCSARGAPRTRAEWKAAQAHESVAQRQMAALTALCLVTLLLAWGGESGKLLASAPVRGLYIVSYMAGGYFSARRALRELRTGSFDIDLLMVMAALGAATIGEWPEGAVLLFLFSLSNTLEHYVLGRTRRAIAALLDLSPEAALVRRDGQERRVPVDELRLDDIVIVQPGERIAADGVILRGATSIDQAAMTGESMPVEKSTGDEVFAGTLNQQGAVEVQVRRLAGDSTLAKIVRLVEEAQSQKAQSQRLTDWFGQRYTAIVIGGATLTLFIPILWLGESPPAAFYRAMTVLVVASPCAVVISIPAALLAAITGAARGGLLFKGGAHLERAATIRAMAFDRRAPSRRDARKSWRLWRRPASPMMKFCGSPPRRNACPSIRWPVPLSKRRVNADSIWKQHPACRHWSDVASKRKSARVRSGSVKRGCLPSRGRTSPANWPLLRVSWPQRVRQQSSSVMSTGCWGSSRLPIPCVPARWRPSSNSARSAWGL